MRAMLNSRHRWVTIFAVVIAAAVALLVVPSEPANALSGSSFDPGNIISNAVFFNKNAMTEAEIQSFLEQRLPTCAESSGVPCIKNYRITTSDRAASPGGNCEAYVGAASERASTVIYKVAQACGINPQVLLVTLQKEQGLIGEGSPTVNQYNKAMGYACPDSSICDAQYYGFFNQVYKAAWQFRQYTLHPNNYANRIGPTAIAYSTRCSGPVVDIKNQATANLYNYTPYQPTPEVLANLRGSFTSPCSAYGNRNFWVFFNDWFGNPTGPVNPIGVVESVTIEPGFVHVVGWVYDPNFAGPTQVHMYLDGIGRAYVASGDRPDATSIPPEVGIAHGFDVRIPVQRSGAQPLCVYGINQGPGENIPLQCFTVSPLTGSPKGQVDSLTSALGSVTVAGWAYDPDSIESIPVHVYVDGSGVATVANVESPSFAQANPGYGSAHGYSLTVAASPGLHTVCAYGINAYGPGVNASLGCKSVTVSDGSPIGQLESVEVAPGTLTVTGWAIDPDSTEPTLVHLYTDASAVALVANVARPDVAVNYPDSGEAHGFSATYAVDPGTHRVCAYGINLFGNGGNKSLGCKTVNVPSGSPVGALEFVRALPGQVQVQGWAYDPDVAASIPVHVYVGPSGYALTADIERADVTAIPTGFYGANHGFSATLPASPGSQLVCAYGIESGGTGSNRPLGCRTVTIPTGSPYGVVDAVTASAGSINVVGWVIDPDTADSIPIHVYTDGVARRMMADQLRPDVGAAYPGYGDYHGFNGSYEAAPGRHYVCVYAIEMAGTGSNSLRSCRTVVVP